MQLNLISIFILIYFYFILNRLLIFIDLDYASRMNEVPGLIKDGRAHRAMTHHQVWYYNWRFCRATVINDCTEYRQGAIHHGAGIGGHHVGTGTGAPPPPPVPPHHHGCVMMVYGLDPATANTDRLFNLVCLYGNVARVSVKY